MTRRPISPPAAISPFSASPPLFDKCALLGERVAAARAADAYCYFRAIESAQDPEVVVRGRTLVMLGTNNYLGLPTTPR